MTDDIVGQIRQAGISIYSPLTDHPELFIDHERLEDILNSALVGLNLNYRLKTRSKIFKSAVCEALGYPTPSSFKRSKPRFPGQNFDTYVQKADNLQIWNDDISVSRRYVIVRVNDQQIVTRVRVVTGEVIQRLDKTGTLTHKYQAKSRIPVVQSQCVSQSDTNNVVSKLVHACHSKWPGFLEVKEVFTRLQGLIGTTIPDPGIDQERNRGSSLHTAVCRQLGLPSWNDDGQFPDITEQLIEVKLQTAATIDLGLVCPDSEEQLADSPEIHHRDVRYAVIYGETDGSNVRLNHLILTTGEDFFTYLQRFEGKVKNSKRQMPLPSDFFD